MSLSTFITRSAAIGAALALALVLSFSAVAPSQAASATTDGPIVSQPWHGGGHGGGHGGHGGGRGW